MIPWAKPSFWGNEEKYVMDALKSTWISSGKYVTRLEAGLAELFNTKYALTVSNGTTAIHLAYIGLGIQPGNEIIVPGFGFMAAPNIALHVGAKPVFVEVDEKTWCMNDIEAAITPNTKVIVATHTFGNLCNLTNLKALSTEYNIPLIEDCAESICSTYNGKHCGTFGKIGTFSFHATKTLTTGEGGLVITDDEDLFHEMFAYRSHGLMERGKYNHVVPGHNFRLTNLQAAMGCAQLENLDEIVTRKIEIDHLYRQYFQGYPNIKLQTITEYTAPVIWAFAMRVETREIRNELMSILRDKDIETRPGFAASSQLPIYHKHILPICECLADTVISLPSFPSITNDEIRYICDNVIKSLEDIQGKEIE